MLKNQIIAALKKVYDPEMPVNIYELGLIYGIDVDPSGQTAIRMTLTAPNCPVAGTLPGEVERAVRAVPGRATPRRRYARPAPAQPFPRRSGASAPARRT